ncbi:MAG TPA: 1-acyl-sn-glycerol-3-phosphate acyltransferase [Gammaproteobacteria bacterium]|nr:1-acyl-sn-glycerol-3-phosphate acyltransferase [Gammaproteobacteria bacterium]
MLKTLKNLIVLPLVWLMLIALSLLLYLLSHMPRALSGRYYHYLSRLWCRLFIRALDVDLRCINKNTQALPEQYILIANHPSALEDFGVPALFDIYPLAKAGVRDWIVLGRISDYAGTIYVERGSADSRHAAKKALLDAVKAGKNIVIFPEGGCKGSRIYEKFQTGAFDISLQTGVPILPVFLHYIDQNTFEWTHQTLVQKLWQIFKSNDNRVNYYVHDALSPGAFKDRESFTLHTHALYLAWQKDYLD